MKVSQNLLGCTLLVLMSSCGQKSSIKSEILASIEEGKNAQSLVEWKTSEKNPSQLFEKMQTASADEKAEFCHELSQLSAQELLTFEEEMTEKENQKVLENCFYNLTFKLEKFYLGQRDEMKAAGMATVEFVNGDNLSNSASGIQVEDLPPVHLRSKSAGPSFGDTIVINEGNLPKKKLKTETQYRDLSQGYYAATGDVKPKQVILSFDDGPHETYTPAILTALREMGVKAMYFQMGYHVEQYPELTKAVAADGHTVGSHTYSHHYLGPIEKCGSATCRNNWVGGQEALAQIRRAHQAIYNVLGWVDPFFRFPYGAHTKELREFLVENKIGEFFWSIDSRDWSTSITAIEVLNNTLRDLDAKGRGMILFHDVQRKTVEILPQFLREIAARGYEPVILRSSDPQARYNSSIVNKRPVRP